MAISKDRYCIEVCGGKCCTMHDIKQTCPQLDSGCKCKIYQTRFAPGAPVREVVGWFKHPDGYVAAFECWQIEKILENKILPKSVEDGCCYAHPELLEGNYGTEITVQK